jgi:peroxiredoxin
MLRSRDGVPYAVGVAFFQHQRESTHMRPALAKLRFYLPGTIAGWLRTAVLGTVIVAVALGITVRALAGPPQTTPALMGHLAPDFALPTERNGKLLTSLSTLDGQRGHPVLVTFFYTLCVHCLSEVQAVQTAAQAETADGVEAVFISSPAERPDIVDAYLKRLDITSPALIDTAGQAAARYSVRYYPTVVLVDAHGIVRDVWMGETGASALEHAITHLG